MTERPPFDEHTTAAPVVGKFGTIRILDAEANRATEGLRVVEDYVRFVLDDRHLTKLAKELRHDLAAVLEPLWQHGRLAARAADADVGAMLAADLTAQRESGRGGSCQFQTGTAGAAQFGGIRQADRSERRCGDRAAPLSCLHA